MSLFSGSGTDAMIFSSGVAVRPLEETSIVTAFSSSLCFSSLICCNSFFSTSISLLRAVICSLSVSIDALDLRNSSPAVLSEYFDERQPEVVRHNTIAPMHSILAHIVRLHYVTERFKQ